MGLMGMMGNMGIMGNFNFQLNLYQLSIVNYQLPIGHLLADRRQSHFRRLLVQEFQRRLAGIGTETIQNGIFLSFTEQTDWFRGS